MNLNESGEEGVDRFPSGSGQGQVVSPYESTKGVGDFTEGLSDYLLLKKDSASWR
jgi:hypothetical protein